MASQTKVFNTRDSDSQKREEAISRYQANYRRIYGSISGDWFSFGDERMLKESFRELASTTHGQQILANLGDDFSAVRSTQEVSSGGFAAYDKKDNFVQIDSELITQDNKIKVIDSLSHELLHAVQDRMGFLDNKGLSSQQATRRNLLCEAETFGWGLTCGITNKFFGTLNPNKEQIQELLQMDGKQVDQKIEGFLNKMSPQDKPVYKKFFKTFYDNLKKSGGNLYYAQRKTVGAGMIEFMNTAPSSKTIIGQLKKAYEKQAVEVTRGDVQDLSSKGNNQEVQRHYDYLAQQYGVSRAQLEKEPLSAEAKAGLASVEENVAVRESFEKEASLAAQKAPRTLSNAAGRNITQEDNRSQQPTSRTQSEGRG